MRTLSGLGWPWHPFRARGVPVLQSPPWLQHWCLWEVGQWGHTCPGHKLQRPVGGHCWAGSCPQHAALVFGPCGSVGSLTARGEPSMSQARVWRGGWRPPVHQNCPRPVPASPAQKEASIRAVPGHPGCGDVATVPPAAGGCRAIPVPGRGRAGASAALPAQRRAREIGQPSCQLLFVGHS